MWDRITGPNNTRDSGNSTYPSSRLWSANYATNNSIYIFGGQHKNEPLSDLWKYDILSNTWSFINDEGENSSTYAPGSRINATLLVREYSGYTLMWVFAGTNERSHIFQYDSRAAPVWLFKMDGVLKYPEGIFILFLVFYFSNFSISC